MATESQSSILNKKEGAFISVKIDKITAAIKNAYNLISHKISFFYKKLITSIRINYPHIKVRIKKIFPYLTTELATVTIVLSVIIGASLLTWTSPSIKLNNSPKLEVENDKSSFNIYANKDEEEYVIEYAPSQFCFIGDSRIVGIQNSVETDAMFIAETSRGLSWFNKTALKEYENKKDKIETIVVALGINDIKNVEEYIKTFNEFAENNSNKRLFYVNIGPVDETKYKKISNETIVQFNEQIKNGLNDKWVVLDQYAFLQSVDLHSHDGLHYGNETSQKIFDWILETTNKQILVSDE